MCGIIGIYNDRKRIDEKTLAAMTAALRHRGPGAFGSITALDGRLGIAHTRLKLVDLSPAADQPAIFGKSVLSFNGEIYNHNELREELRKRGAVFTTKSDTEVLARSILEWGMNKALGKLNGCFAFIFLDETNRKLYVVRDHAGKKQVVYCRAKNGDWVIASEVKAIIKHPYAPKQPNIDRFASDLVFKFFSDKTETYFKDIFYVPAGHYLVFDLKTEEKPKLVKYWDIDECLDPNGLSESEIMSIFENYLKDSVSLRMSADCEVGSILSGGIDSSIITKFAADTNYSRFGKPLQCITMKYCGVENRDLQYARQLALASKKMELHEIEIKNECDTGLFDKITLALEEPLLDKVYLAQYANYEKAKKLGLRAVINGQGSDELWLGYYFFYKIFRIPPARVNYENLVKFWLGNYNSYFAGSFPKHSRINRIIVKNLDRNFAPYDKTGGLDSLVNFSIKTHLPAMFIQEDRLSMASGVEARCPHVDLRLIKLALSTPAARKIKDRREKYLLRKMSKPFLPQGICSRRKLAFPDPPNAYDRAVEILFNKKDLQKSAIIGEIFDKKIFRAGLSDFYRLPIRKRWELIAVSRMEKVFFA